MFEEELNDLYGQIVSKMCEMIPCEYESIHFNGDISEDGGRVFFFFNTKEEKDKYIYSLDIPNEFNVSEKVFYKLNDELFELTRKLNNVFIENGQEAWKSVTMHYNNSGKFELKYSYIDWFEQGYGILDRVNYFKYLYLNMMPYGGEKYLKKMKKMEKYELEHTEGNNS